MRFAFAVLVAVAAFCASVSAGPAGIEFDAREQWPGMIETVLNQEKCAGSWAVSSVSILKDRMAIADKLASKVGLPVRGKTSPSALDLIINNDEGNGCRGGEASAAFNFIAKQGVVTSDCMPYAQTDSPPGPIRKCGFDESPCMAPRDAPEVDKDACYRSGDYQGSKFGNGGIVVALNDVAAIETSISSDGPVAVTIDIYAELINLGSKIYRKGKASLLGRQTVKLIGWGTDPEEGAYWLAVNTFGPSWGEEGVFRIAKGTNEVGVETNAISYVVG